MCITQMRLCLALSNYENAAVSIYSGVTISMQVGVSGGVLGSVMSVVNMPAGSAFTMFLVLPIFSSNPFAITLGLQTPPAQLSSNVRWLGLTLAVKLYVVYVWGS